MGGAEVAVRSEVVLRIRVPGNVNIKQAHYLERDMCIHLLKGQSGDYQNLRAVVAYCVQGLCIPLCTHEPLMISSSQKQQWARMSALRRIRILIMFVLSTGKWTFSLAAL